QYRVPSTQYGVCSTHYRVCNTEYALPSAEYRDIADWIPYWVLGTAYSSPPPSLLPRSLPRPPPPCRLPAPRRVFPLTLFGESAMSQHLVRQKAGAAKPRARARTGEGRHGRLLPQKAADLGRLGRPGPGSVRATGRLDIAGAGTGPPGAAQRR